MVHGDPASVTAPAFPDGVTCRDDLAGDEELGVAVDVNNRAFVDHWDFHPVTREAMAHELASPGAAPGLNLYGYIGTHPVGLCLCSYNPPLGFVAVLGTDPQARGRGVASALLRRSFVNLAARGATRVELHVDSTNPTGAVRLYERAGMVMAFAFKLFELELTPSTLDPG
jgi:mycothiol synthase